MNLAEGIVISTNAGYCLSLDFEFALKLEQSNTVRPKHQTRGNRE